MMQLNDPSSTSIIPIERPLPVEVITYMDSDLFTAAEDGNMDFFSKYQGSLQWLVDGRQNTALHIYSRTGGRLVVKTDNLFLCFPKKRLERNFSVEFVEQLVQKCPSLLLQPNDIGEIPLHIAARHGHYEIVEFLIQRAQALQHDDVEKGTSEATSSTLKQMLRMRDKEENTALHEAAGRDNVDVVRLLMKELDPDFSFSANKRGETPLYIAAKRRGNHRVVDEILHNCKSINFGGPGGTTALHAAVMERGNEMRKLIEAKKQLTKETDDKGRTPLHYVRSHDITKMLLEADATAAYITDKERGMSPLHIAACRGREDIMELIISHCPGCCEIVDNRGWNFLYIAAFRLSPKEMKRFLSDHKKGVRDLPIRNLLNQKDVNGNTPFHVLLSRPYDPDRKNLGAVFKIFSSHVFPFPSCSETQKKQIRELLIDIAAEWPPIQRYLGKKEKEEKEMDVPQREIKEKARENHLLVATLVATVTFAASFTVPGGYNGEQGTAIVSRDSAFKAFVITDTLAFVSSLLAIFLHFIYALLDTYDRKFLDLWIVIADWLTFSAMVAMAVAFSTGTYVALKSSLGFAITTCSLGLVLFPALPLIIFFPFFRT